MRIRYAAITFVTFLCGCALAQADPELVASGPTTTNVEEQLWNFHAQNTDVVQGYPGFSANYSGPNSLTSKGEVRETISLDLYGGVKLWDGAEAHVDALTWQGFGLSKTLGVEAFPNGEAFKIGANTPDFSFARLFIRQTIGLGGEQEDVPDTALSLAGKQDVSRLTLTLGRVNVLDTFDTNTYANDPRTQFMNWAFMTNGSWDYPADTIGFTTGLSAEFNQPHWTLRYGFFQMPSISNSLTADGGALTFPTQHPSGDGDVWRSWGMPLELERRYAIQAHPGAIRFLAWLNSADMGSYQGAVAFPGTDIVQTRIYRYKYGFGLNWEQEVATNVGVFTRLGWNDGKEQAWAYTDTNYSIAPGLSFNGAAWNRPGDTWGVASSFAGASTQNQAYLEAGGTGILDGDGALSYSWEKVLETYYDFKVWRTIHLALDYQFVDDPAFNSARGPVHVMAVRYHMEF